jgi:hypothetical protein
VGAIVMNCYSCNQPAERSCTRCGRFFCSRHGGDRLVDEGAGEGHHVVTRGVCDNCTPDQEWMRSKQTIGIQTIGIIVFIIAAIGMLVFAIIASVW